MPQGSASRTHANELSSIANKGTSCCAAVTMLPLTVRPPRLVRQNTCAALMSTARANNLAHRTTPATYAAHAVVDQVSRVKS